MKTENKTKYFIQVKNGNYKVLVSSRPKGPQNYRGIIEEVFDTEEEAYKYIRLQEVMNIYYEMDKENQ